MQRNAHTEEAQQQIKNWKGHMKEMYSGLQEQNDLEEMANDNVEELGLAGEQKKQKKGFFSKMNDQMSSAMHQNKQMNSKAMSKKK